jgi:hypothetical protein
MCLQITILLAREMHRVSCEVWWPSSQIMHNHSLAHMHVYLLRYTHTHVCAYLCKYDVCVHVLSASPEPSVEYCQFVNVRMTAFVAR